MKSKGVLKLYKQLLKKEKLKEPQILMRYYRTQKGEIAMSCDDVVSKLNKDIELNESAKKKYKNNDEALAYFSSVILFAQHWKEEIKNGKKELIKVLGKGNKKSGGKNE